MAEHALQLTRRVARREGVARNAVHALAAGFFLVALVFAIAAWSVGDSFYLRLATEALIYALLALSVDILLGFTGLLSLGQALYFGLGAYTSALVLKHLVPSFWAAIVVSVLVASIAGVVGGYIAIRARGVYFALITFGLAQVVAKVVYNTRALGASDGIIGIPVIEIDFLAFSVNAGDPASFFLLLLAVTVGLYFAVAYLMDTPFGRVLAAIRSNEKRVPFLGYKQQRFNLAAFVLAAAIAGLGGAFYPMLRGFVSPELMFFAASGNAVINVIVGGVGTLIGPVLGAVILTALRSLLGTVTEHHLIVIGLLFMASVIFLPKGLVGWLKPRLERALAARGDDR